jgi:hypothetical protein
MKPLSAIVLSIAIIALGAYATKAMVRVAPKPNEPGVLRYDIRRQLSSIAPSTISGYFAYGGNNSSISGRIDSRNIVKAIELYNALISSKTTAPELIKMGKSMRVPPTSSYIGLTYLDHGTEKSVDISTFPGMEDELFGPSCGQMIKEIWAQVSIPQNH